MVHLLLLKSLFVSIHGRHLVLSVLVHCNITARFSSYFVKSVYLFDLPNHWLQIICSFTKTFSLVG